MAGLLEKIQQAGLPAQCILMTLASCTRRNTNWQSWCSNVLALYAQAVTSPD